MCLTEVLRRKLFIPLLLTVEACSNAEPHPAPPSQPHTVQVSVTSVAGCYELTAFQWPPGTPANVSASIWPQFFILQSVAWIDPWEWQHPIVDRDTSPDAEGSWRLSSDTEITMEWYRQPSTFLTVRAQRPSWENSLLGFAKSGREPRAARVVMERIPCWAGADLVGRVRPRRID